MVLTVRDYVLFGVLLLVDQVTKWLARSLDPHGPIFSLVHNTGAGFGILQGQNTLLLLVSIAVLVVLYRTVQSSTRHEKYAYVILYAGICGNAIDRIVLGAVTDFISIGSFPVFNAADSYITVSILYLVATGLRESFSSWNFRRKKK